jgi:hypothetical protein
MFHNSDAQKNDMAPYLLRSGRPPNADPPIMRQYLFDAAWLDPSLLVIDIVYIMTPPVASEKHPSVDRLGEVGSGTRKQETDDKTKESEDGTEDLDNKNLDEPV